MTAYIIRRLLLMIPTLLGIMLVSFVVVQFAPGGPVERVIAQLSGRRPARPRAFPAAAAISPRPGMRAAPARRDPVVSKYRGAQGLDPQFIKELEKQFGFDKPAHERFLLMLWNFATLRFRQSYFRDVGDRSHQGEIAGVDLARHLDDAADLSDLDSARHPQGVRDGSRFDVWTSGVIIIGYAIPGFLFAILLIILFAGGSFFDLVPACAA
jgi:microcin C transport system permease protein